MPVHCNCQCITVSYPRRTININGSLLPLQTERLELYRCNLTFRLQRCCFSSSSKWKEVVPCTGATSFHLLLLLKQHLCSLKVKTLHLRWSHYDRTNAFLVNVLFFSEIIVYWLWRSPWCQVYINCWMRCKPVFENTYFTFFSDLKKNMTFYVFWNDVSKKSKKSQKASSLLNVYRKFGLKTPGCYRYL